MKKIFFLTCLCFGITGLPLYEARAFDCRKTINPKDIGGSWKTSCDHGVVYTDGDNCALAAFCKNSKGILQANRVVLFRKPSSLLFSLPTFSNCDGVLTSGSCPPLTPLKPAPKK